MNNRAVSITFKNKISSKLPIDIQTLSTSFSKLGIYETNIEPSLKAEFKNLLEQDFQWVSLLLNDKNIHEQYLVEGILELNNWITGWKEVESKNAGSNSHLLNQLRTILRSTRIRILSIMLWRKLRGVKEADMKDVNTVRNFSSKFIEFATTLYESSRDRKLETLVLFGKRDFFKSNAWPSGKNSIPSNDFFELFTGDFQLFLEKGINQIYVKEIKKQLNISESVSFMDLERIYNYFFGSYLSFVKFLNRNFQYELIELGLEKQNILYDRLQNSTNTTLTPKKLIITNCPFPKFKSKCFDINIYGLGSSSRYCNDKLVIFGKDAHEEFTTDISLPNTKGIDSIFAFIYVNNQGYHLVDISKSACIRIKVWPGTDLELENGMIVVFAKTHAYIVKISDSILLGGKKVTNLTLEPAPGCGPSISAGSLIVKPNGERLFIGRNRDTCNLILEHQDISQRHAEIYLNNETSKWLLKDLKSTNGTFYRLKTFDECENETPSTALKLEGMVVFCVQSFTFLIRDDDMVE